MNFKGYSFKKTRDIVQMPARDNFDNIMPYVEKGKEFYVIFGRIVKVQDKNMLPPDVYVTQYRMSDTGEPVYAKPIKSDGHSLTNMMYGEDGFVYLMRDGSFYRASNK